mmetsp:Transcript_17635/g.30815  ORF Transcript_17635/g.30815 Transcript_17635/m.30815 type:complete len:293 (+) Transcript_17635:385-1263(+)
MPNINTAQPSPTSEEDSPIQDTESNTNTYYGHTSEEILETFTQACRDTIYSAANPNPENIDYSLMAEQYDPLKTPLLELLAPHAISMAFLNQDPHLSILIGAGTWNNNFVALSLPPEEEGLYLSVVLIPMTTPLLRTVREASKTAIRNNRSAPFTKPSTATRAGTQHPCIAPCPTSWVKEFLKTTMPPHRALAICLDQPVQPLHQPHKDFHSTWFRAGATHMQDESGKPFPTYSALYTPATLLPLKELATTHPPLYRLIHDDLLASWGKTATDLLQQLSASAASTHVHPTVY